MHLHLLIAQESTSIAYRFVRLYSFSEWWQWLLLAALCIAVTAFVIAMYYKDSVELSRGVSVALVVLRLTAFIALLFFFLGFEKVTQRKLVNNSRTAILIDTSQSMGLRDADSTAVPAGPSRIDQVTSAMADSPFMEKLREKHDVVVYRFDQESKPIEIASYKKRPARSTADNERSATEQQMADLASARRTALIAGGFLALAVLAILAYLLIPSRKSAEDYTAWSLLAGIVCLIVAVVILGVAHLRHPDIGLLATIGLQEPDFDAERRERETEDEEELEADPEVDWTKQLIPRGVATRLGDAVRHVVQQERGGPIAGIVVFTDGRNNAGIGYEQAVASAQDAGIPIFPVGVGSLQRPANVRIVDLEAPERVYPGDDFELKGYVQSYGLENRTVDVQLLSRAADGDENAPETIEDSKRLQLDTDGQVLPLSFRMTPSEEGKRQFILRISPPPSDTNPRDNETSAVVEIVDEKNRVLLFAGGPTREFRFVRNLLFRDADTELDVLLQTGKPGISQEADNVLFDFPTLADELFEYDCIVAFDPDWMQLDELQISLLERWVAEKAGGLVVVAGPVFTPEWTRVRRGTDRRVDTIKTLYPVVFIGEGSTSLTLGKVGGDEAWPLMFTRDGLDAKFLWLDDDPVESEKAWAAFPGVFGYYAVRDKKEGARVYARFSDPNELSLRNEKPIYMAGHFYGAGRVFFQASGEMWRLRAVEEKYLEQYYTKLIRWVSQGRLLRDSQRGILLVDKERCFLGDTIAVSAILQNAQHEPLQADQVAAVIVQPDGTRLPLSLQPVQDAAREGTFIGSFQVLQDGDYEIELQPPQLSEETVLTQSVRVRAPALETEQPNRHDSLLKDVATKTGGQYYVGVGPAIGQGTQTLAPIPSLLESHDQPTFLPGTPDKKFEQLLMTWLMGLICGVLSLEWIIRRLSKLA